MHWQLVCIAPQQPQGAPRGLPSESTRRYAPGRRWPSCRVRFPQKQEKGERRALDVATKSHRVKKNRNWRPAWGEEILDKLAEPFFNRLRAEERAST